MYISTKEWRDLEDGHIYHAGEKYPHDGREDSADGYPVLIQSPDPNMQ